MLVVLSPSASGQVANIVSGHTTGQVVVAVGKSQLVRFDQPFHEISVGNREVVEVQPLSRDLIYVLGKKIGTTNLSIIGGGGKVVAVMDVAVGYDLDGIRQRLHELLPDEKIDVVTTGDAVALTGTVANPDHLHQAIETAEHFAPGKVSNLLSVAGSQQVLLRVKFAEVQRTAFRNLDSNGGVGFLSGGDTVKSGWGPQFPDPNTGLLDASKAFGGAVGTFVHGNWTVAAGIEALEKKGLVRTLAEPTLIALSGDTANFLAGGEFPIPVAENSNGTGVPVVTIQYKQFGVSLAFTPTIVGKTLVNLVLKSEVSALDKANAIQANGFQIPALKVRRATTTVELNDGQSFAIAGLLQDDFDNSSSQIPFLGDIPVLGTLFSSRDYNHQQTDLVMIITAHVVSPTVASKLRSPTDTIVVPTPLEHFGTGKLENSAPAKPDDSQGYVLP